jgi:hypothetical protein
VTLQTKILNEFPFLFGTCYSKSLLQSSRDLSKGIQIFGLSHNKANPDDVFLLTQSKISTLSCEYNNYFIHNTTVVNSAIF